MTAVLFVLALWLVLGFAVTVGLSRSKRDRREAEYADDLEAQGFPPLGSPEVNRRGGWS